MSFPRYEKYQDSGVEWLTEIPTHWSTSPLSALAVQIQTGPFGSQLHSEEYVEDQTPVINPSNIGDGTLLPDWSCTVGPEVVERLAHHKLKVGDIVVARRGEMGRCGLVDQASAGWLCGTGSLKLRMSPKMLPEFASAFLRTGHSRERLKLESVGSTMDNLNAQILGRVQIPVPPLAEQLCIVRYLSANVAKIDALVGEQRGLIELLKEKRQAVIARAVTVGLSADALMKDSGVQWLGRIPAHWDAVALKRISPAQTVGIVVNPSTYIASEGLPFLYGGDIRDGRVDLVDCRRISAENSKRNAKTRLQAGDLVTVRVGAPGVTAVVPQEAEGGNCASVMLIRRGDFDSRWLCYTMNDRVVRFQVEIVQYGAAQEQFNISHAVEFILPRPSRDEQTLIADYLDKETARLDDLVAEAEAAMRLLVERRAALISAAVTGKIDVRDLAPQPEAVAA